MTIRRSAERWAFAAALLAIIAYAVADRDALVFMLGVPSAIAGWIVTRGSEARTPPRFVINLLLFVAVAWGTLSLFSEGLGVSLFSEFVASLVVIKIIDRRGCRDTAQILTLSTFLVIGAILTSNSFMLGVIVLVFIPVIITGVLWYQLARVEEASGGRGADPGPARRPLYRRTVAVAFAALGISTAVFLLMPREIGSRALGTWGAASVGRVVGFNDEVRLGMGGLISESAEPVLDLELYDRQGDPIGSVGQRFYLRGAVLDAYDRRTGTWTRSERSRNDYKFGPGPLFPHPPTAISGGHPRAWNIRQEVTIRNIASERGHLFSIWQTNQARVDPPAQLQYCSTDGTLRVQGHGGKVSYTVYSNDRNPPPLNWEEPTAEDRDLDVGLSDAARFARDTLIANGIEPDPTLRSARDDASAVRSLSNIFSAGDYRYTLETMSAPAGQDPVEWFLLDSREGHCEYYASALAVLCRAVGIDARVITGYVATDWNETTSSYIVRASNAHAWVEAEVLPGYWRTYDPTPSADLSRIHEPPRGMLAGARRFFDTLEFAWIRTVVGYDAETRSAMLGPAGPESSVFPVLDRIGSAFERTRQSTPETMLRGGRNALIVFCIVVAVGAFVLRERRRLPSLLAALLGRLFALLTGRDAVVPPEATLHRALVNALRRGGVPKPAWVPLRAHTRSLIEDGELDPDTGAAATRLVERLYAALFAAEPLGPDAMEHANRELRTVRTWADKRAPARRRRAAGR